MRVTLLALMLLFPACGNGGQPTASAAGGAAAASSPGDAATAASAARTPLVLDHDFGLIPHGEQRTHEFALDMSPLVDPFVPLRVHLECSCGRADLRLRKQDGSERFVDGTGYARNMPAEDEQAILHIQLDTRKKEAVDLPTTVSRGYILLQPLDDPTGLGRIRWTFVVRFAIDAPVELRPFAAFEFGKVAESTTGELMTTLRGDENHRGIAFGNVRTTDQNLEAWLEPADGHTILRTRCRPGKLGHHRALVQVDTNFEDYKVAIQAAWKVVPDLEATPIRKVSFMTRLDQPQAEGSEVRQFVLCTDHNPQRSPEFALHSIVDERGREVTDAFEVQIRPVSSATRQQRVSVRYLGGLTDGNQKPRGRRDTFRGKILLKKRDPTAGAESLRLPIDLVVFPPRQP